MHQTEQQRPNQDISHGEDDIADLHGDSGLKKPKKAGSEQPKEEFIPGNDSEPESEDEEEESYRSNQEK